MRTGDNPSERVDEWMLQKAIKYGPVHAKRYKLVKIFKICFFAENVRKLSLNHLLCVFIVSYCMKLIYDVIKGNRYGDNI